MSSGNDAAQGGEDRPTLRIADYGQTKDDGGQLDVRLAPPPKCKHFAVTIDEDRRIVTCRSCGHTVDPIVAMVNVFKWAQRLRWEYDFIQNHNKAERQKAAEKRKRCRRCHKLFKPVPVNGAFPHWGVCDPCWGKNPKHER